MGKEKKNRAVHIIGKSCLGIAGILGVCRFNAGVSCSLYAALEAMKL
jgi:hypothetical protein